MFGAKLKIANRQKLCLERQLYKLRNTERSLCEELYSTTTEIDLLTEQLEELKNKISETTHRMSQIEIQKVATRNKIESYVCILNKHKMDFDEMFTKERAILEQRNKELKIKEEETQEMDRQRQKEIEKQNELQAVEASVVEDECSHIERECLVLKKRNNAIMLKLRRKLIETEDARRDLMTAKDTQNTE